MQVSYRRLALTTSTTAHHGGRSDGVMNLRDWWIRKASLYRLLILQLILRHRWCLPLLGMRMGPHWVGPHCTPRRRIMMGRSRHFRFSRGGRLLENTVLAGL